MTTIGKKLWAGFGVALLFPVFIGAVAYRSTATLLESRKPILHTYEVLGELDDLMLSLSDCQIGMRGYLLTNEVRYLEPYNKELASIAQELARLLSLTADNPAQQARMKALRPLMDARLDVMKQLIDQHKAKALEAAEQVVRLDQGKKLQDEIRGVVRRPGTRRRRSWPSGTRRPSGSPRSRSPASSAARRWRSCCSRRSRSSPSGASRGPSRRRWRA